MDSQPGGTTADLPEILAGHDLAVLAIAAAPLVSGRMRLSWHEQAPPPAVATVEGSEPGRDSERTRLAVTIAGASPVDRLRASFPRCQAAVGLQRWHRAVADFVAAHGAADPERLADFLVERGPTSDLPASLVDLARLEATRPRAAEIPDEVSRLTVNPTLSAVLLGHRVIAESGDPGAAEAEPELALVWHAPGESTVRRIAATALELLVLKLAVEGIRERECARLSGIAATRIAAAVDQVAATGLVLRPRPGLHRTAASLGLADAPPELLCAHSFTLQWHLTSACDLHCLHCYDRTSYRAVRLDAARSVIADFVDFCRRHRIWGDFCLSGGNPLLHADFLPIYRAIASTGMSVWFLGNPAPRASLEEIVAIRKPDLFQVSLEGLEPENDRVRGRGHFARTMAFLELLGELGIPRTVMVTLGRDNLDQVIPLGEQLAGRCDFLVFNRLAQVGEGAALDIPETDQYRDFLLRYEAAARDNPIFDFKDNLFNILRHQRGEPLTDGCTGFGCGAAFNFIALLPDGEAHACRKLPSPLGNLVELGMQAIYDSPAAARYRAGSAACTGCPIRAHCGGCLAVSHGAGRDPLTELDPHCFLGGESRR